MSIDPHRLPRSGRVVLPMLLMIGLMMPRAVGAADRVYPTAEAVKPLAPGARVPSARVQSVRGESVDLADLVRESGALLVFYRGGW